MKLEKEEILARIDNVISELKELRQLVANEDIPSADTEPKALGDLYDLDFSEQEKSIEPEEEKTPVPDSIFALGSDTTLYFDSSEDDDLDVFLENLHGVDDEAEEELLADSFVEKGSTADMHQTFEAKVHFHLIDQLSLADNYLFANELFAGNQAELKNVLSELEQMSSLSQAEDYLYNRLGFDAESEEVKRLWAFIHENASFVK